MNTIVVVELKRYGWSQKIVRKSFVIVGKPPYAKALKLRREWRKVLPHKNGAATGNAKKAWLFPTASDIVRSLPKQA
jgi:hypothetical protein